MINLIQFLKEDAAAGSVGAGSIATYAGAGRSNKKKKKKGKGTGLFAGGMITRFNESKLNELYNPDEFDEEEALANLKATEKRHGNSAKYKAFVIEDDDGETVKIWVNRSDADEIEKWLENKLSSDLSIAEIVFQLNKEFDVMDAEWSNIPEDEEETQIQDPKLAAAGQRSGQQPDQNQQGGLGLDDVMKSDEKNPPSDKEKPTSDDDENPLDDLSAEESPEEDEDGDLKSTLKQVIDMLKSDVDAKKAEAEAKKAEADAKKAEETRKASAEKMKIDAELLDAEEYFKKKKESEQEEKKMALLQRYRYEKSKDGGDDDLLGLESVSDSMASAIFENFKKQYGRK